ncbi:MAG: hypothetical protein HY901_36360 [Deltaproteobacteria bacterium]|nr:hypothetical protein [Deltaproteobacteria bacterium]
MTTRIMGGQTPRATTPATKPNEDKNVAEKVVHDVSDAINRAASGVTAELGSTVNDARSLASRALGLHSTAKGTVEQARKVRQDGFQAAFAQNKKDLFEYARQGTISPGALGAVKKGLAVAGLVTGAIDLPGRISTTAKDLRDAMRDGGTQAWNKVGGDVAGVGRSALYVAYGSLEVARDTQKLTAAYKAASSAFSAAAPEAMKSVVRSAATKAAVATIQGRSLADAAHYVTQAATTAAKETGSIAKAVTASANRAAARAALHTGGKAAAEAGLEAGARSATSSIARAAGRFAPGLNVAIAALDTASALSTLRDASASTGKKICSCMTAAGSTVSATNIPIASQLGAAVSIASGVVGGYFFPK